MASKGVGHYRSKSECMTMIEKTVQTKPVKRSVIYYFAMSKFGFGKKLVDEMMETLLEAGIVNEDEKGVLRGVL